MSKPFAFSEALALESFPDAINRTYNPSTRSCADVTLEDLIHFARTVAYKTAFNLGNGLEMNPAENPLDTAVPIRLVLPDKQ